MTRRTLFQTLLAAIAALTLLSGCSSHSYESRSDEHYDFSKLSKVAILHPDIVNDPLLTGAQRIFDRLIAEEMRKKGYEVTDKAHADFYIVYHLGVNNGRQLSNEDRIIGIVPTYFSPYYGHYGYSYMVGQSLQSHTFSEGKIIVEAIDPHQDDLVFWNAKMTDSLKRYKNEKEREDFLQKVVEKVFATFPNRQK